MAKQEVLDAINATVAPNNIKGITADSLRNVLTLMTENAGSGEGTLMVMAPLGLVGPEAIEMDFTPEYWEQVKIEAEIIVPGTSEQFDPIVEEIFRHNAEVYPLLMEKAAKNEGVMCVLDMSAFGKAFMELLGLTEGVAFSINALSLSSPSAAVIVEAEPAESAEEMGWPIGLNIIPLYTDSVYPFSTVELRADGSLRMYTDVYGIDYVYVPSNDEAVLSDNQKASNALWKERGNSDAINEVRTNSSTTGEDSYSESIKIVTSNYGLVRYFQYDETTNVTNLKQATIANDGSVTVTVLGTLNPPTA